MTRDLAECNGSRRDWIYRATATLGLSALGVPPLCDRLSNAEEPPPAAGEPERIAKIEAQAKHAGVTPIGVSRTTHFLGVGNASGPFRKQALEICEALGRVFLKHLRDRGFRVVYPDRRLMVVVLRDAISYGSLVGEAPGKDVGGHFDLDADRLVVFDFRPDQGVGGTAERINTFTLVHETAHLLTFNTGLLAADPEPAKCITEGLATYFEMWRLASKAPVGRINQPRLIAIRDALKAGEPWISTKSLMTEDALFDDPKTAQLAYGQSWLMMYHLLSSRSIWPNVVDYLADLRTNGRGGRVAMLEKHLGPIATLDDRLRTLGRDLVRGL
ncbi:DUF1570 domain-containing protein [Paludisphaera mucosa]|uniref:DUF1570 domain-containing protein n=1 Tax=Paludisphaera mucosa TaxID=3030827 RepID=A0ABT6F621_9BACT|nr:DUF1570 domain-containing protein [Paludisphaera mucosa]MDG3003046.1 DUF1570 domain-containing protein [Paludisphaera mucosa]